MKSLTKEFNLAKGAMEGHCSFWNRTLPDTGRRHLRISSSISVEAKAAATTCAPIPGAESPVSTL